MTQDNVAIEVKSSGRVNLIPGSNPRTPFQHQIDAMSSLNLMDHELRTYSTLVVLPTGGGKTYTLSNWLLKNAIDKRKKVIWIAHRQMLLDQAAQSFQKFSYFENMPNISSYTYRIISGSPNHDRTIDIKQTDDILIVSKDSLGRKLARLDEWIDGQDEIYLIIDEAHHSTAKTYRKVIDYLKERVPHLKLIGITATPFRTADKEQGLLGKIYHDGIKNGRVAPGELGIAYEISLKELINKQILSRPIFEQCDTDEKYGENLASRDWEKILNFDTIPQEVQEKMAKSAARNKLIVKRYTDNIEKYGQTIVFALNKIHAIQLNAQFEKAGVKSGFIVSDVRDAGTGVTISPEENAETIRRYADGEIQVLINVNILTEGVDLPQTKTVFLTRPTVSRVLMTQMIGRALRGVAAGGTKESYIVSFIDRWNEYIAWVNPETLLSEEGEFEESDDERIKRTVRLIYIAKVEEFARILDDSIPTTDIESIPFIDRIPVGMYAFTYSEKSSEGQEESADSSYQIMVYRSTAGAYTRFMSDLPKLFEDFGADDEYLDDKVLQRMIAISEASFFGTEMLPPYDPKDIEHAIKYFAKEGVSPNFYSFEEVDRAKLDLAAIARKIVDADMTPTTEAAYVNSLWDEGDSNLLKTFFNHKQYFVRLLGIEKDKILHPEFYGLVLDGGNSNVEYSTKPIEDFPLSIIAEIDPAYESELRNGAFERAKDGTGLYVCANCGYSHETRRPFQVDHIIPMNAGGKSVPENLQILCRNCNAEKSDKYDD